MIENGTAGFADGFLWLYTDGITIAQAARIFLDPDATARILFQYGEMEDVYEGFTQLRSLMLDEGGQVSVCLVRG